MKPKQKIVPAGIDFSEDGRLLMSSAKTAEFFNVTDWTIREWGDKGCPKEKRGWWDVKAVMEWLGKVRPSEGKEESDAARKLKAEADLKEAQAKKEALEYEAMLEKYFLKEEVEEEWAMRIHEVKNSLLALSKKIGSTITDPDMRIEIEKSISEEVYNMLEQYARYGKYTPKKGTAKKEK